MDEPETDPEFLRSLSTVLTDLAARASAQRRESEPWAQLWEASEHGLESLLGDAERRMNAVVLDLADVIAERFGVSRCSPRLWDLLRALPFAMRPLQEAIREEQGMSCCGDKARFTYYEEVLAEINRIKGTPTT